MKGIVFNLLEEVVTNEIGADTWDTLLDDAGLEGAYTSLGSYGDDEVLALVAAASQRLDMPPQAVLRWFGQRAIRILADRYPQFFARHESTIPFILTLNEIIHPEVRKLYPGADVPDFRFESLNDDGLVMEYVSARRMCGLALGMIEGAARHYGEQANVDEVQCMHRGASSCVTNMQFSRVAEHAA